jgi:hypothetical protein
MAACVASASPWYGAPIYSSGPNAPKAPHVGVLNLRVVQVEDAAHAALPVSDADLDDRVRQALEVGLQGDTLGARLYRGRGPVPDDVAVGLTVEFYRDGTMVKSWPLQLCDTAFGEPVDWIRIQPLEPGWHEDDPSDLARWTVTVKGDPAVALRDFVRPKAWAGAFTMSLKQFLGK